MCMNPLLGFTYLGAASRKEGDMGVSLVYSRRGNAHHIKGPALFYDEKLQHADFFLGEKLYLVFQEVLFPDCFEKQMQQREAFRRDIRVEYERQRQIEQEIWEARRRNTATENWYNDAASVSTDQRRRKLIATKASLANHAVAAVQQQQDGSVRSRSSSSDTSMLPIPRTICPDVLSKSRTFFV